MPDIIELEPEVRYDAPRAWVLDDKPKEANQVAVAVSAAGLNVDYVKLSDLSEHIHKVLVGQYKAPDVALIDLQWSIGHSTIRLGNVTIEVDDKSRFGLKIARHLRTMDEFRRCRIVIATQYADRDIRADLDELGMAVLIPKTLIRQVPGMVKEYEHEHIADAGIAALNSIGLRMHPRSARGSNPKVLAGAAKALGLDVELALLAGASRRDANIAEFLSSSRDARERVTLLRLIVSSLRAVFGETLPDVKTMGSELQIELRHVLLNGSQMDLQRVLWALESRGGGGSDVYDEAV